MGNQVLYLFMFSLPLLSHSLSQVGMDSAESGRCMCRAGRMEGGQGLEGQVQGHFLAGPQKGLCAYHAAVHLPLLTGLG